MCFVTKEKKAKIARKDIPIWKILQLVRDEYVSPIQHAKVKFDVVLCEPHFNLSTSEIYSFTEVLSVEGWFVQKGFHTFLRKKDAKKWIEELAGTDFIITKGIIPKDSYYYKGIGYFGNQHDSNYLSNKVKYFTPKNETKK